MDIPTWTSIASLVISAVALIPRSKRDRTKDQQAALLALSEAYHTTAKYLEYRGSHERDRDREWDIAGKWDNAAVLLRPYDPEKKLYERLYIKSRFWREGANWEPDVIKDANIGLSAIWREVHLLLDERA